MLGGVWLTQDFEREAALFECASVGLKGSVDSGKGDPHPRVLTRPVPGPSIEVGVELEGATRLLGVESAGRAKGMGDRDAEAAPCFQDARDGRDGTVQIEDVLEGHERDREICATASKRKGACVCKDDALAARLARHSRQGPRSIDADDSMASLAQEPTDSTFPTGYVERKAPRGRNKLEETGPVEVPKEVIVFGRPREAGPRLGLLFPGSVSAHETLRAVQRTAAKLRPRVILPRSASSMTARAAEARGRQLQRLVGRRALQSMDEELVLIARTCRKQVIRSHRADSG